MYLVKIKCLRVLACVHACMRACRHDCACMCVCARVSVCVCLCVCLCACCVRVCDEPTFASISVVKPRRAGHSLFIEVTSVS